MRFQFDNSPKDIKDVFLRVCKSYNLPTEDVKKSCSMPKSKPIERDDQLFKICRKLGINISIDFAVADGVKAITIEYSVPEKEVKPPKVPKVTEPEPEKVVPEEPAAPAAPKKEEEDPF